MVKLDLKNKEKKKHFLVGMLLAVVASAMLPEKYNPVVMFNGLLSKIKS